MKAAGKAEESGNGVDSNHVAMQNSIDDVVMSAHLVLSQFRIT